MKLTFSVSQLLHDLVTKSRQKAPLLHILIFPIHQPPIREVKLYE